MQTNFEEMEPRHISTTILYSYRNHQLKIIYACEEQNKSMKFLLAVTKLSPSVSQEFSGINFSKCFLAAAIFNCVNVVGILDPAPVVMTMM
jgi:hypothetical protein